MLFSHDSFIQGSEIILLGIHGFKDIASKRASIWVSSCACKIAVSLYLKSRQYKEKKQVGK